MFKPNVFAQELKQVSINIALLIMVTLEYNLYPFIIRALGR